MKGQDEPPYPCPGKGCLKPSKHSLIWPECPMIGSSGCPGQVLTIFPVLQVRLTYYNGSLVRYVHHLPGANALASITDKPVATSYLACLPHPWHVVCTGGYSNSRIPMHGPYHFMSYIVWDPHLTTTYPSHEQRYPIHHKCRANSISLARLVN
jgi:hypothetical protein